ncbi:MAG: CHAP domain-containing protein [Brevinema sp.]
MFKRQILLLLLLSNVLIIQASDSVAFYEKLASYLPQTVGLKEFPSINKLRYNGDCSGFVAFIFHLAGLNLRKLYGIADNGVTAIWEGLKTQGFLLNPEIKDLQAGDIVFFDNTYDMNKNALWDDELSHIGVVESVDEFNTVTYIHYGSRGVVRAKMNLHHPQIYATNINSNTHRFNDLLRASEVRGVNPEYLSGSLYRGAARLVVQKKVQS